ncbi:protein NRT1/ PTR FAMILY 5.7-like [Coffea eugenioides]|uniref:Protein NRT1/ PTR FAMILY 5.7-like n=1 Tax=Coffea arabica TaxID=13443 RepID=A0ABM4X0T5_COFAR|nr:protein NRT1/ PTR FAMILY 5.7-like [Coffea eugenioides]
MSKTSYRQQSWPEYPSKDRYRSGIFSPGICNCCISRKKRLRMVESALSPSMTLSVLGLAPQTIILGIAETFSLVGFQEYLYEQMPDSMQSLGMAFYLSVIEVGRHISCFLASLVVLISEMFGTSWIGEELNSSRSNKLD